MAEKPILRSKVLNATTQLIELYENKKGSKELNPLLNILRDVKASLLSKTGAFVSPKIAKKVSDLRNQLSKLPD